MAAWSELKALQCRFHHLQPSRSAVGRAFFAGFSAAGTDPRRSELNSAHFHPEMVSLPLHPIPINKASHRHGVGRMLFGTLS
jgi:hypothetical protein